MTAFLTFYNNRSLVLRLRVFATPVLHGAPVMTVTGVDVNRDGIPDVLQQLQFGLALQGFATPVLHGAPVNKGMTTVTGVGMNCDGIPNL